MEEIVRIRINKNRGWRGLAELVCENSKGRIIHKIIFSFSEQVWRDMLDGYIVIQDTEKYYVLEFDNTEHLPAPTQQRSVLIKNFTATVTNITAYGKHERIDVKAKSYRLIHNFVKNRNNHTTSDWNCIGIRVVANI